MPAARAAAIRRVAWPSLVMGVVLLATAAQLRAQGRPWWCSCGTPTLWAGDVWSRHNSQHLLDPYSLTHLLHGLVLCGLAALIASRLPPPWQLSLAPSVEALWEVAENTDFMIRRYREATASLGYQGDAVANSLGDLLVCGLGVVLARRLGYLRSLALFVATEVLLILWIRDSLLLSVLMLAYPIEAVKAWQIGR